MKHWFTARELAHLGLPGVPKRPENVTRRATAENWPSRPRPGRGGGSEYHIDGLPAPARAALAVHEAGSSPSPLTLSSEGEREEDPKLDRPAPRFCGNNRAKGAAPQRRDAAGTVARLFEGFRRADAGSLHEAERRFVALWREQAGQREPQILPLWVLRLAPAFSVRTLRRWRAQARKSRAGADGRMGATRSAFEALPGLKAFATALVLKQPHLTAGHIRDLCRAEFGDAQLPAIRSFQRFLTGWKADNAQAIQRITAPDEWRSHKLVAVGSASACVEGLNHLWEIDASPADMLCAGGRHSVYAVVDVWSRRMLVTVTKTPRTQAVLLLVRRAILEWGVPLTIKTDNGSDFTSKRFMTALQDLGIEQALCAPFNPQSKPHVERAIGTLQRDLMPTLPGFIGHCVADRKRIEQRRAFGQRLGEGAEKAFSIALDADALQGYIDAWAREKYAHRPHAGLGGVSPFARAMGWNGPVRRIESERALDLLLAPIAGADGFRTVSKKGIRLERGYYFGAGLAGYVGRRVFCRCDPEDLGKIFVFSEDMAFVCEAHNIERLGVDRVAAAAQAAADQKRFMRETIEPLKREMKKIDAYSVADTLRDLYAKDNRTLAAFPKPGEIHSTPALEAAAQAASPPQGATAPTPEQEETYRSLLEEYRTARAPAARKSDEDIWWERRVRLQTALATGEAITPVERQWLESTANSYWVKARQDFEAYAAKAGGANRR